MTDYDYYQMLGVARDATAAQLRAAFAREAKRTHPDLASAGRAIPHRLAGLQSAFRTLSQPDARAAYDQELFEREWRLAVSRRRLRRRLRKHDRRRGARVTKKPTWRPLVLLALVAAAAVRLSIG